MIKLNAFGRGLAGILVAAQLSVAGVAASTVLATAPASAAVLGTHGSWTGITMDIDGRTLYGVKTHMSRGGMAAILVDGNKISLVFIDDKWSMRPGQNTTIAVSVDGRRFTGEGTATGGTMIVARNIDMSFVKALVDGNEAYFDIGGVRWNLMLDGFTASFSDALNAVRA